MFWRILLAHVLADYPLQPDFVVFNKRKAWGLGLHIGTHYVTMLVLVGPARSQIWPHLLLLAGVHLLLDVTKSSITPARASSAIPYYLLDQFLHVISIFAVSSWIDRGLDASLIPAPSDWPLLATGYIVATYVWFITERTAFSNDKQYLDELEEQFWPRMVGRAVMLTAMLLVSPGWSVLGVGMAFRLPYTAGHYRRRALTVDIIVAVVTAAVINLLV
jgi:hypothetical protein